jgi:protein-S-isoprenylcysteine O-methyltransferase Ste14
MTALKTIIFFLLVPGVCMGVVPVWLVLTEPAWFSFGAFRWLVIPLWLAGWAALGWCFWNFTVQGRGTPNPLDPPRKLVVTGLYRSIRNPMYIGATIILVGYVLWSPSLPILLMPVICFGAAYLFVRYYEEPHLRKTFGATYENYCCAVPRWIPHWKRSPRE